MEPAYASFGQTYPPVRRPQRSRRRRNLDRNQPCWRCRINKARCDGRLPCGRCFENAYPCGLPRSDEEAAGGAGAARARGGGGGDGGGAGGPASDIVPAVYQNAEYAQMVQAFLSSFDRLQRAGLLDERRIVQIIAQWRASSARLGHDGSHSLTSELERRLRASREAALEGATQERLGEAATVDGGEEEEEEEEVVVVNDVMLPEPLASRRRLTPVESSEMQALIFAADKLCSSTLMRCHDDGMTPTLFLGLIDEASQAGAAEGTISLEWGRQLYPATNPPFAAAFQTASELIKASIRYRVPSFLLLATLCAPDDRGAFFAAIVHALFGKEGRPGSSDFIKMATRTGDIDVYLLRAARLELDGGRQEETPQAPREAVTLSFLRVPPSRHISLRPHIFSSFSFTASRTYRRSGVAGFHTEEAAVQPGATVPAADPVLGAMDAPAPGRPVRVPAIAALTLSGAALEQEGVRQQLLEAAPSMSGIFEPRRTREPAAAEQEEEGDGGGGLLQERISSASAASASSSGASSSSSLVSRVIKAEVVAPPPAPPSSALHAPPLPPPLNVAPTSVLRLDDASAMERLTPALCRLAGGAASNSPDGAFVRSAGVDRGGESGGGWGAGNVENRYAIHGQRSQRGLPPVPVLSGAAMAGVFSGSEGEGEEED